MQCTFTEILGGIAGVCTTFSLIPQVVKIIRSKNVSGLSLQYFSILITGVALWVVYGIIKDSPSLVIANAISFFLVAIILSYILKYGEK